MLNNDNITISFTYEELKSIADQIEFSIFDTIRNDSDIDSISWFVSIATGFKKMDDALKDYENIL